MNAPNEDPERQAASERWTASRWLEALKRLNGFEGNGLAGWKYTGKFDARPLGLMLSSGLPVPENVVSTLGAMLCASRTSRRPRLTLVAPPTKRTFDKLMKELSRKWHAADEYRRLRAVGVSHKQAIFELGEFYGVKRTWLTDAIAMTDDDFTHAVVSGKIKAKRKGTSEVRRVEPKSAD